MKTLLEDVKELEGKTIKKTDHGDWQYDVIIETEDDCLILLETHQLYNYDDYEIKVISISDLCLQQKLNLELIDQETFDSEVKSRAEHHRQVKEQQLEQLKKELGYD